MGAVPEDQAIAFVSEINRVAFRNPGRVISWQGALRTHVDALKEKHARAAEAPPAEWWIVQDPGRQWTASRHPTPTDGKTWLGTAATHVVPSEDVPVEATMCVFCRETIVPGAPGTVTTRCGHAFHFFHSGGCDGAAAWQRSGSKECPVCRASFEQAPPRARGSGVPHWEKSGIAVEMP